MDGYCFLCGTRPFICPDGFLTRFLRVFLSQMAILFCRSSPFLLLRFLLRVSWTFWACFTWVTCAISSALAETLRDRLGACLLTALDLFDFTTTTLEASEWLLSPSLPERLYTDMLGCSMSRFSRSVTATRGHSSLPAVKHEGGVSSQASFECPCRVRINKWRECETGLKESGVERFDGLEESLLQGLVFDVSLIEWVGSTKSPW